MNKIVVLLLFLFCSSCFTRSSYMNQDIYDQIGIGASVEELKAKAGSPMQVKSIGRGQEEYLYVEKVTMGSRVVVEHQYILVVSGGKVISKRMKTEEPPAYDLIYQNDPGFNQN